MHLATCFFLYNIFLFCLFYYQLIYFYFIILHFINILLTKEAFRLELSSNLARNFSFQAASTTNFSHYKLFFLLGKNKKVV